MRENSLGMRLEFVQFHASDVDGVNLSRVGNGLLLKEIPVSYSVHTDRTKPEPNANSFNSLRNPCG
jgi:hypothetical protein